MTTFDEINALSDLIAETDDRIGQLRDEIRSFQGQCQEGEVPLALDPSFDIDEANKELNSLLKERFTANTRYQKLTAQHESEQQAEAAKLKADLAARYRVAVAAMLESFILAARAVAEAESLREQARRAFGHSCGCLPFAGPELAGWNLRVRDSFIGHWVREAREHGLISGQEQWLKGIVF